VGHAHDPSYEGGHEEMEFGSEASPGQKCETLPKKISKATKGLWCGSSGTVPA
jgi:hypothetical protein